MISLRFALYLVLVSIIHAKLRRKGKAEDPPLSPVELQRQHNLQIIPLVEADTDRAYQLHQTLYSLLWLKRRIVGGTDKLMKGIPQIAFWFDPHFYRATVSNYWIDYQGLETKTVNVTIEVLKITNIISNLRIFANGPGDNKNIESSHKETSLQPVEKAPEHGIHHYYYYLQGSYHCRNKPTVVNATKCDDAEYYLDGVYVQIFPVYSDD